jgi:hypothetical protein
MNNPFEKRAEINEYIAEMLMNMTDPDDVGPGQEEEFMDNFRVLALHLLGSLQFTAISEDENGIITATIQPMDQKEYMKKIIDGDDIF